MCSKSTGHVHRLKKLYRLVLRRNDAVGQKELRRLYRSSPGTRDYFF
jgi:hypothetical protein